MRIKVKRVAGENRVLVWEGSSDDARKAALLVVRSFKKTKAVKKQWLKLLDSDGVLI